MTLDLYIFIFVCMFIPSPMGLLPCQRHNICLNGSLLDPYYIMLIILNAMLYLIVKVWVNKWIFEVWVLSSASSHINVSVWWGSQVRVTKGVHYNNKRGQYIMLEYVDGNIGQCVDRVSTYSWLGSWVLRYKIVHIVGWGWGVGH